MLFLANLISCFNRSRRLNGGIFIRVDDQRREGLRKIYSVLYCSAYNVPVNWFFLTKNEKSKIAFCSPTKHLGVPMNSLKRVRAFQIELEFGNVGFWEEGKTGEKPLGAKERPNSKLNPTYGTRSTVVRVATLAPSNQSVKHVERW